MKILIVDDELLARKELRQLLVTYTDFTDIDEAGDVQTALELTCTGGPSVVFLDVQLRGESGFDYIERLQCPAPQIVFVTAYDQYALKAFECAAVDYLLKPVDPARLASTARRVKAKDKASSPGLSDKMAVIKTGADIRLIAWTEIVHITTSGNYTKLSLRGGKSHLALRTLKEWQSLVPPGVFVQVHRSTLVQPNCIQKVRQTDWGERELVLTDESVLPVGRHYWASLRQTLGLDQV
jgi:two-component system, LytTR family, response regulator